MLVRITLKFGLEESLNGHKPAYDSFLRSFSARQRMGARYTQLSDDPLVFEANVTPKHAHELERAFYITSVQKMTPPRSSRFQDGSRTILYRAKMKDVNPARHEDHFARF